MRKNLMNSVGDERMRVATDRTIFLPQKVGPEAWLGAG